MLSQIFHSGNVAYDPVSSRLILTTDSPNGEAASSSEPLIPYIPYPINPKTGQPVESHLTPLEKRGDMRLNGSMTDPLKGISVPILGMTIHPVTGWWYLTFLSLKSSVLNADICLCDLCMTFHNSFIYHRQCIPCWRPTHRSSNQSPHCN